LQSRPVLWTIHRRSQLKSTNEPDTR
jgi:hypothetical protein